jgi:hypothetical protein
MEINSQHQAKKSSVWRGKRVEFRAATGGGIGLFPSAEPDTLNVADRTLGHRLISGTF